MKKKLLSIILAVIMLAGAGLTATVFAEKDYEAKVIYADESEKYFDTFDDALTEANQAKNTGSTVVLLKNISAVIYSDKNKSCFCLDNYGSTFTIDGNNHTISASINSKSPKSGYVFNVRTNVTFKNLNIVKTADATGDKFCRGAVNVPQPVTVYIIDCNFNTTSKNTSEWNAPITISSGSTVYVEGGTYIGGKPGEYRGINIDGNKAAIINCDTNGIDAEGTVNFEVTGGNHDYIVGRNEYSNSGKGVTGGFFITDPADYVAEGYKSVKLGDKYKVVKNDEGGVEVADDNKNVETEVKIDSSIDESGLDEITENQEIKDAIKNETKVTGVVLKSDTDGLQAVVEEAIKNNDSAEEKTAIEDSVKIEIEVNVNVIPKAIEVETQGSESVSFKLEPVATVKAFKQGQETPVFETKDVPVSNDMIDETQDISVTIYTGFEPVQITHKDDDGNIIENFGPDEFTYNASSKCATVIIHHFSSLTAKAKACTATIDGKEYETLADAIKAAEENAETTIVMVDDEVLNKELQIPAGKKINLDLNGKKISNAETGFAFTTTENEAGPIPARFCIIVKGKLNITDSSTGKTGIIESKNHSYGTVKTLLVTENGSVNVEDAKISGEYAAVYAVGDTDPEKDAAKLWIPKLTLNKGAYIEGVTNGICVKEKTVALQINDGATVKAKEKFGIATEGFTEAYDGKNFNIKVKGGDITCTDGIGLFNQSEGYAEISGGKITGSTAIGIKAGNVIIKGDAVIASTGEKSAAAKQSTGITDTGDAVYVEDTYDNHKPVVIINGGTFTSRNGNDVQMFNDKTQGKESGSVDIYEGTFDQKIEDKYLGDGCVLRDNKNGTYGIDKGPFKTLKQYSTVSDEAEAIKETALQKMLEAKTPEEINAIYNKAIADIDSADNGLSKAKLDAIKELEDYALEKGIIDNTPVYEGIMNIKSANSIDEINAALKDAKKAVDDRYYFENPLQYPCINRFFSYLMRLIKALIALF